MSAKIRTASGSSEQQPMPERKEKKKNSLEPSCCKDAIPCAGSLKDRNVALHFLLAPVTFCSSASRSPQRGSSFSLAATAGQDEDTHTTVGANEPSQRAEAAKGTRGWLGSCSHEERTGVPAPLPVPMPEDSGCFKQKLGRLGQCQLLEELLVSPSGRIPPSPSQSCPPGSHVHSQILGWKANCSNYQHLLL